MKKIHILAFGPWYPNTAFRYLADAFERNGHKVTRMGPDYNNPYEIPWRREYAVKIDAVWPQRSTWDFDHALDLCTQIEGTPDLLLMSEETYHNVIVPTDRIPTILYSIDGWPENFERVELYRPTIAYMEDPLGIRSYPRKKQDPRWNFLPGAAAPWVHQNLKLVRERDFYFCGTMYVNRPILCKYLSNSGFSVSYGKADTYDYVRNLSTSLATLHDCNGEDRIKWRFFEGLACGCLMLSDYTKLLDWAGYRPWEHYLPVPDVLCPQGEPAPDMEVVRERLSWAKSHLVDAKAIATAGETFTLKHHTYYNRTETILSDLISRSIF